MHLKTEHVLIILLLLPFGLRGVLNTPIIDSLVILGALTLLPALLLYILQRKKPARIGKLAIKRKLLTNDEVSQILYCQKHCEEKFGEIAVKRQFLTPTDLNNLLMMQQM